MTLRLIDYPTVAPNHADNSDFSAELPIPDGVVKEVTIDLRGTTVGTTAVNADSPARLVSRLRIEFPRVGEKSYVIDAPLRDLQLIAELLNARAGVKNQPTSAAATTLTFRLPLHVPGRPAGHEWGIDTRELAGQILVSGTWAAASGYGAGTTSITSGTLRVSLGVADEDPAPRFALLPVTTRIGVDSAAKFKRLLAKGQMDGAFALHLRTDDSSAAETADRVDGLFSKLKLEHSIDGEVWSGFFMVAKEQMAAFYNLPNSELTAASPNGYAGVAQAILNPDLYPGSYPDLVGADLQAEIDAETAVPTGVTSVTPATGDAVFATLIGVQANDEMLALIEG